MILSSYSGNSSSGQYTALPNEDSTAVFAPDKKAIAQYSCYLQAESTLKSRTIYSVFMLYETIVEVEREQIDAFTSLDGRYKNINGEMEYPSLRTILSTQPTANMLNFLQAKHLALVVACQLYFERAGLNTECLNPIMPQTWSRHNIDQYHLPMTDFTVKINNELVLQAVEKMRLTLAADANNKVLVHCKSGRGRSMFVLACFYAYMYLRNDPIYKQTLEYEANKDNLNDNQLMEAIESLVKWQRPQVKFSQSKKQKCIEVMQLMRTRLQSQQGLLGKQSADQTWLEAVVNSDAFRSLQGYCARIPGSNRKLMVDKFLKCMLNNSGDWYQKLQAAATVNLKKPILFATVRQNLLLRFVTAKPGATWTGWALGKKDDVSGSQGRQQLLRTLLLHVDSLVQNKVAVESSYSKYLQPAQAKIKAQMVKPRS